MCDGRCGRLIISLFYDQFCGFRATGEGQVLICHIPHEGNDP